jgi:hypothetical protein
MKSNFVKMSLGLSIVLLVTGASVFAQTSASTATTPACSNEDQTSYGTTMQQEVDGVGHPVQLNLACLSASAPVVHSPYQGSCDLNLVQTESGCLPQGICVSGYGNGKLGDSPWCFPASVPYGPVTSSVPVTTAAHTPYQGSCDLNLVQTANGCEKPGPCMAGYGWNGKSGADAWCDAAVVPN